MCFPRIVSLSCRQSDADIAKLYPKKVPLAKTVRKEKTCCDPMSFGIKLADGSSNAIVFKVKNKPICCGQCCAFPTCNNCSKGIMKGNMCINLKNPIYDQNDQAVAYLIQTAPLLPTSCCTADVGGKSRGGVDTLGPRCHGTLRPDLYLETPQRHKDTLEGHPA